MYVKILWKSETAISSQNCWRTGRYIAKKQLNGYL